MSTQKTSTKSKFTIVNKIMALFNLGEQGKLDSLIGHTRRYITNDIKRSKNNLQTLKLQHEQKLEEIEFEIQDAEKAVEDAYTNVDFERLETNASQKDYVSTYLQQIKYAEDNLNSIISRKERTIESYNNQVKDAEEFIAKIEARLEKIN